MQIVHFTINILVQFIAVVESDPTSIKPLTPTSRGCSLTTNPGSTPTVCMTMYLRILVNVVVLQLEHDNHYIKTSHDQNRTRKITDGRNTEEMQDFWF